GLGPGDVRHRGLVAPAQLAREGVERLGIARGEHRLDPAAAERLGGQAPGVSGGSEQNDAGCHGRDAYHATVDEHLLTERLITYATSSGDGLRAAAGFVKGWLESRDLRVRDHVHEGLPVVLAGAG